MQVLVSICGGIALLIIGVGAGIGLADGVSLKWHGSYDIGYADFIGIVLSALSVLLAILTIFLAVFGFIGWASISERLRQNTYSFLGDQIAEGKPLYNLIRKEVRDAVYEGVEPVEEVADHKGEKDEPFEATE
jgi:hypothetical protein